MVIPPAEPHSIYACSHIANSNYRGLRTVDNKTITVFYDCDDVFIFIDTKFLWLPADGISLLLIVKIWRSCYLWSVQSNQYELGWLRYRCSVTVRQRRSLVWYGCYFCLVIGEAATDQWASNNCAFSTCCCIGWPPKRPSATRWSQSYVEIKVISVAQNTTSR